MYNIQILMMSTACHLILEEFNTFIQQILTGFTFVCYISVLFYFTYCLAMFVTLYVLVNLHALKMLGVINLVKMYPTTLYKFLLLLTMVVHVFVVFFIILS